jgi:uncharacterized repeat protein (TIGR01451 family)
MFRDIVSNLSLSPAASSQLAFYWRRLGREQLTRQLSAVMAVALIGVQLATMVAPSDAANASSPNDVICGGIGTSDPHTVLMQIYDNDHDSCGHGGYHALFDAFGITRAELDAAKPGTVHSDNHAIMSVGRSHEFASDTTFQAVAGGDTYYFRPLYLWDDGKSNTDYPALIGTNENGHWFAVLDACGNIETVNITPTQPGPVVVKQTPQPITSTPTPSPTPTPVATTPSTPTTPVATTPPATTTPITPTTPTPKTPNISLSKSGLLEPAGGGPSRDANGATAGPGDIIQYTLTTTNSGQGAAKNYVVTDNISDVLEYADIIDPGGAILTGGNLSWQAVTIAGGASQVDSFQVRVKNPIPTTPTSTSDPTSYDFKINDVYGGDLVSTSLAVPTQDQVEVASKQLPETGAGTDSLIVLLLASAIVYFYFRNRQLITEIDMLRGDHYGKGGPQ